MLSHASINPTAYHNYLYYIGDSHIPLTLAMLSIAHLPALRTMGYGAKPFEVPGLNKALKAQDLE
jgi:hypothetical protein